MKRFAATGSFHELLVVGVQIVEQQPDLRSWKVIEREISRCTLKNPFCVSGKEASTVDGNRWLMGDANQIEMTRVVERI